jgi:hypothetical protein
MALHLICLVFSINEAKHSVIVFMKRQLKLHCRDSQGFITRIYRNEGIDQFTNKIIPFCCSNEAK